MLTEEEKDIVSCFRSSGYQPEVMMVAVIDRLMKENEELQEWKYKAGQRAIENINLRGRLEPVEAMREDYKFLQSQLDAIKKAWAETLIKYNSVAHHFSFVCDEEIELGDAIEALDKLIGGGK